MLTGSFLLASMLLTENMKSQGREDQELPLDLAPGSAQL